MSGLLLAIVVAAGLTASAWAVDTYLIKGDWDRTAWEKLRPVWRKLRSKEPLPEWAESEEEPEEEVEEEQGEDGPAPDPQTRRPGCLVYVARFVASVIFLVLYLFAYQSLKYMRYADASADSLIPLEALGGAFGLASLAALVLYAVFFWGTDTRISRPRLKDTRKVARINKSIGLTLVAWGILLPISALQAGQSQLFRAVVGSLATDFYMLLAIIGAMGCFFVAFLVFRRYEDARPFGTALGVFLSVAAPWAGLLLALWIWWFMWSDPAKAYYANSGGSEK